MDQNKRKQNKEEEKTIKRRKKSEIGDGRWKKKERDSRRQKRITVIEAD